MGGSGTCGGMDGHTREHRRKGEHRRDQTRRRHLHDTVQQSRTWRTGHAHSGGQGDEVGHRGGGHQQDKRGREDAGKRDHHGLQRLHAKDSRDMFSTGRGGDRLLPCDTEAHRRAGRSPAEGEAGSRGGEQTERGGFQAGRGAKGQTEEILQETASEEPQGEERPKAHQAKDLSTRDALQRRYAGGTADKGQVHPAPDGGQVERAAEGTCQADVCPISEDKGGLLPDMLRKEHLPQQGPFEGHGQKEAAPMVRRGLGMHLTRNQVRQRLHQVQGRGGAELL